MTCCFTDVQVRQTIKIIFPLLWKHYSTGGGTEHLFSASTIFRMSKTPQQGVSHLQLQLQFTITAHFYTVTGSADFHIDIHIFHTPWQASLTLYHMSKPNLELITEGV